MGKAARAIIVEDGKLLVMQRDKEGSRYFTLVGGRVNDDEDITKALIREVKEETGLDVIAAKYVFYEEHPAPYNEQFIFLCSIAPHGNEIKLLDSSEEAQLNRGGSNIHTPMWANIQNFDRLPFRTPQLQQAILKCLKKGFPEKPERL